MVYLHCICVSQWVTCVCGHEINYTLQRFICIYIFTNIHICRVCKSADHRSAVHCVCVCVCVCMCMSVYACENVCVFICVSKCVYVCVCRMCACMRDQYMPSIVCVCVCMHAYACVSVCVYLCVCPSACMCVSV